MPVVGEIFFTSATKSLISCALLIVAVGLFGLQRYTRPAPLTSGRSTLRSVFSVLSVNGADLTATFITVCAKPARSPHVGDGMTTCLVGDRKTRGAFLDSSHEPTPSY